MGDSVKVFRLFLLTLLIVTLSYISTSNNTNQRIIIAVLDTGFDFNYSFFNFNILKGFNIIEKNKIPQDNQGHGTIMINVIRKLTPNVLILPVKVISKSGVTTKDELAEGIIWATNNGANIINISAGVISPSSKLKEAVEYAENKNVLVIAATGNNGDKYIDYPAAFSTVLAVGAVDISKKRKLVTSNYGSNLDIVSLGEDVPIINRYGKQEYVTGTSVSASIITSIAGNILIKNPDFKPNDIRNIIIYSAIDIGESGCDLETGYGFVDNHTKIEPN